MTAHDKAVRAINTRRKFTILDICCDTGIDKARVTHVVTTLVRKGHLRKLVKAKPARGHLGYGRYELIRMIPARVTDARTRVWRSMRVMRRFTVADLAAVAEAGFHNTHSYIVDLVHGGYVRKLKMETPRRGVEGRAVFALIKDTGPLAPSMRFDAGRKRIGIFDPNVVGQEEVEGGCRETTNQNGLRACAPNARAAVRQR